MYTANSSLKCTFSMKKTAKADTLSCLLALTLKTRNGLNCSILDNSKPLLLVLCFVQLGPLCVLGCSFEIPSSQQCQPAQQCPPTEQCPPVEQCPSAPQCPPLERPPCVEFPLPCGNNVGDRCSLGCERGAELIGSCFRVCCFNGNWTGYPAYCINRDVQCPVLAPPLNGRFVGDCFSFGCFRCRFECDPGLPLIGSPTTDCLSTGQWSTPPPVCGGAPTPPPTATPPPFPRNSFCQDLNPPLNGLSRGSCVNASTGMMCRFECDMGFALVGNSVLTCLQRGWSSLVPTCQPIICPDQTAPANGHIKGFCAPGVGGKTCTVICAAGYRLSTGYDSILCQANMLWDSPLPACVPITCPPLPTNIFNGQASGNCNPGLALTICTFQCDPGYAVAGGSSALLCQLDGNWSGNLPTCTRILCRSIIATSPAVITSGQCDPGYANSCCAWSCAPGYQPRTPQTLYCYETGLWDRDPVPCTPIPCPPLIRPDNGEFLSDDPQRRWYSSCQPGIAGQDCTIQCNQGYLTIDREPIKTITCDLTGNWTAPVPECLRVTCRPIQAPMCGKASDTCLSALSLEQCIITCNINCAGGGVIICGENGFWSVEPPPTCDPKLCTDPNVTVAIPNGVRRGEGCFITAPGLAGKNCVYECNSGFALLGNPSIPCVDGGPEEDGVYRREGAFPRCVQIVCPVVPVPDGATDWNCGNVPGTVCRLVCEDGKRVVSVPYYLYGVIRCLDTGLWTGVVSCEDIPKAKCFPGYAGILNGVATNCNPGEVDTPCEFKCNYGYALVGNAVINCLPTGVWDGEPPFCRQVYCPALQSPSNGFVSGECAPGTPGNKCRFTCNTGYTLVGTPELDCQGDGAWSSVPPTCERGTCPALIPPQPGGYMQGTCQPGRAGEMCTFFCPSGYRIFGLTNLVCMGDGNWNGVVPSCIPVDDGGTTGAFCPPVLVPAGGTTSGRCIPGIPGQVCTITCPPVTPVCIGTAVCLPNGSWSPGQPYCRAPGTTQCGGTGGCRPRRRCCPRPRPPRFVIIFGAFGGHCSHEVGSKCSARCNAGYTEPSTKAMSMTCMRNRRWNANVGTMKCTRKKTENSLRPWINVRTNETRHTG